MYTVNSEIIARFLLMRKMRQSCKRNNLNFHFEIFYMNLTGSFFKIVKIKIAFKSEMTKSQ